MKFPSPSPAVVSGLVIALCLAAGATPPVESPAVLGGSIDSLRAAAASRAESERWVKAGNELMQKTRDTLKHDFAAPEAAYKKALSVDKDCIGALVGLAWVRNSEHKFEEGKDWAEKALALDPRCQDAHALLGDYAVELGNYDEAYEHCQAALDIRADLSSYSRAGHLLWLTGDSTQAQVLLEKAIAAGGPFPENIAWCHSELALIQFHSGAILAASQQAKMALDAAPENPRVLAVMGKIHAAGGQVEKAIECYRKSIGIMPGHDALAGLYDLYQLNGDPVAAKAILGQIEVFHSPVDPLDKTAPHAHGNEQSSADLPMFLAKHDLRIAEAVSRAEEIYKTYHSIRVEDALAWCYYKQGNYQKARLMSGRAMKWKTRDASIFFHAGMIQQKLGNDTRARELLTHALDLNPNFDPIESVMAVNALREIQATRREAASAD